jgi:hypothetical protein
MVPVADGGDPGVVGTWYSWLIQGGPPDGLHATLVLTRFLTSSPSSLLYPEPGPDDAQFAAIAIPGPTAVCIAPSTANVQIARFIVVPPPQGHQKSELVEL